MRFMMLFLAAVLAAATATPVTAADAPLRLSGKETQRQFMAKLSAAEGDAEKAGRSLDAEIAAFQSVIEEGFVFRRRIAALATELRAKTDSGQPLTGADLDRLNAGISRGAEIARRIFAVVDVHANWRTASDRDMKKAGFPDGLSIPLRTKGAMLSLAGSLFLYDSYRLQVAGLAENDKIRRVLNRGDKGYSNPKSLLDGVTEEFISVAGRGRAAAELRYCEENQFATAACYSGRDNLRWLQEMIAQSPSRRMLHGEIIPDSGAVGEQIAGRTGMLLGGIKNLGEDSMNTISLCFGNTVGLVETRKGRLWGDAAVAARVRGVLRPGDILLEKTPFRLTDTFIPGHWGHAAIWLGDEAELKALGLWDDPVLKPYQENIRAGKCIVEALRGGVTLNTIEHFLNIDDLGILREPALETDRETLRRHLLLTLRQVGKEYDFNFDVETTDKIVCSELVYVVYTDITWPTDKTLGRYTISPDNVAAKAFDGGPLRLVLFYHDGRPVTDKPLERMALLMAREAPVPSPPSPLPPEIPLINP